MNICGLQKTTLLDYPGHVAATVFLGGCNFKCPFCHNMNIVIGDDNGMTYSKDDILAFLNKRKNILDGVCITGGEPTLYSELPNFIKEIKEIGYLVKLDTNGSNPEMLKSLVAEQLIDYVAMDIKTSREDYPHVAGIENISSSRKEEVIECIDESVRFLLSDAIDYEFRTTIVKQYHNKDIVESIGKYIKGAKRYYLQSYADSEYVLDKSLCACGKEELLEFVNILTPYVMQVEIRGVE